MAATCSSAQHGSLQEIRAHDAAVAGQMRQVGTALRQSDGPS